MFLQSVQNYFLIGAFVETQNTRGFVVLCICAILNCFCVVCVLYIFVQFCTYENLGEHSIYSKKLKTLDLHHIHNLTDNLLRSLLKNSSSSLQNLDCSECFELSDRSLTVLADNFKNLKTLQFTRNRRISNAGITELTKSCRKLDKLDFESCVNISDSGIISIGTYLGASLEQLVISFCETVTNEAVIDLLKNCKVLKKFDCESCWKLNDSIFTHFSETIRWVGLLDCNRVTHSGIETFKKRFPDCKVHAFYSDSKTEITGRAHSDLIHADPPPRSPRSNVSITNRLEALAERLRFRRNPRRSPHDARAASSSRNCCVIC